jgi:hypothetical protein
VLGVLGVVEKFLQLGLRMGRLLQGRPAGRLAMGAPCYLVV